MKSNLFQLLYEHQNESLSGEEISRLFGVSRAAVWKHIKALKEDGAEIESITNKGYKMTRLPNVLKPEYLEPLLPFEEKIIWLKEIDSTNSYAKKAAQQLPGEFAVIAEAQTAGRGRRGRNWVSPVGENIYMTFVVRPEIPPRDAPGLTLAAALAVCDAVQQSTGVICGIKWPNDIIVDQKKVCGILTEMTADMDQIDYVAIGIGINVNQSSIPEELKDKAISLKQKTGKAVERLTLCAALARAIRERVNTVEKNGVKGILEDYEKRSILLNREIYAVGQQEVRKGTCVGFTETGALLFQSDGKIEELNSGEISIRGVNGYV